jgi:lipopolysaccharide export system ATP-binding protein
MRLAARSLRVVRSSRTLLRDVSLVANPGDVVGVLGPSGAGKSTLFKALAGEISVTRGDVSFDDELVTRWPLWRRARCGLGYIPQHSSVLWRLTVRQNLKAFHQIVYGTAGDTEGLAVNVGLHPRLDTVAGHLSAGERRRLEFARAIVAKPRILICDEPFAGIDPIGAAHLGELLKNRALEEGTAVLIADHHVAEALKICTRAILLVDGAIAIEGTPEAFRAHPLVVERYLGS